MPKVGLSLFALTVVFTSGAAAQPVSKDALAALKVEWLDAAGAPHCMNALRIYSDPAPLETPATAVAELVAGLPAGSSAAVAYRAAAALPSLLATATSAVPIDTLDSPGRDGVFESLKAQIDALYVLQRNTGSLDPLKNVVSVSATKPALALYRLLTLVQITYAADWRARADWYRAGYALDRNRLFALVKAVLQ